VYMKDFISLLEQKMNKRASIKLLPMQDTDVFTTYADISALEKLTGYCPTTPIEQGLEQFLDWYNDYTTEISLNLPLDEKNAYNF